MTSKSLLTINNQSFSERDVMQGIQNVLVTLQDTGDLDNATRVLTSLDLLNDVSGKAKAYLLWGMNTWYIQNKPEEDFGDYIESTTSTKRVTVLRYVNVWEQIEKEEIPKSVQRKPLRELIPIAALIQQGFIPTKKEWDKIELASNISELGEVIRGIKGKKPRKSGMKIELERDGSLYVWIDNTKKYLGYLTDANDTDIQNAIERIISGANIIRR